MTQILGLHPLTSLDWTQTAHRYPTVAPYKTSQNVEGQRNVDIHKDNVILTPASKIKVFQPFPLAITKHFRIKKILEF